MPDILRRDFAPISEAAWAELDAQAAQTLRQNLAARKVVDFSGPHGWELGAVNAGRVEIASKKAAGGVPWGVRQVQPLIEMRIPFHLRQIEIDNITRGAADADLDPLVDAATRAAQFEDRAVFQGFAQAKITGLLKAAALPAQKLPVKAEDYPAAVAQAVKKMAAAGIVGPYALVLGTDAYYGLVQEAGRGYPPKRAVRDILEGDVLCSPALDGGVVLSTRGGDFELTVGKDFSLGYACHDTEQIEFFLTETFTFRVLEPNAVVVLRAGTGK